jgi:acetyl-CoA carboxylase biotin carboxyl carrier protein
MTNNQRLDLRVSEPAEDAALADADSLLCEAAGEARVGEARLGEVCRSVTELLASAPVRPSRVCVRVGAITVELEWPDPAGRAVAGAGAITAAAMEQLMLASVPQPTALDAASGVAVLASAESAGLAVTSNLVYVRATTVGTFYRASEPGARPFVAEGDEVQPGQQVGILEAMKMMLPVEADCAGRVTEFLVADATPVEFDAPLIALTPPDPAAD